VPDSLFWDTAEAYHDVRRLSGLGENDLLIVGGEDHKAGEADDQDLRFERLAAWTRRLVPGIGAETHRWSGQVIAQTRSLPPPQRVPARAFRHVHASGMRRALELLRAMLGLPLPRLALRS
jgi:hypothetical protein